MKALHSIAKMSISAALLVTGGSAMVQAATAQNTHSTHASLFMTKFKPHTAMNYLSLTVVGSGVKLGADGKTHDTFLPGNFTLEKGVPTQVIIANFDEGPHTLTVPDLGINIQISGRKAAHVASITTAVVTAAKTGVFEWMCTQPCDGKANGWAMGQDGYMRGKVKVVNDNKQYDYVTIVGSGVKLGSDGKTHDTYLPANMTFAKNKTVVLQFANFDEGPHTFTAPGLNINYRIPGHERKNVASVTNFTFTPTKAGTYEWNCLLPCDGKANGWAMGQPGYMQGTVTIR